MDTAFVKARGVNLGGWLVLEGWMNRSLFRGLGKGVGDDTKFIAQAGARAEAMLRQHQEEFMRAEDFRWLRDVGINAVRIPLPYWIFGDVKPYFGAIDILDWAMRTAGDYGLGVLLDLHCAPGCQNGKDHGGNQGVMEWHCHPENITRTVEFIERLAERYRDCPSLIGIELLNEPDPGIAMATVRDYYVRGYRAIRQQVPRSEVAVVFHDGFQPHAWAGFMPEPEYRNVVLDTHFYNCFTDADKQRSALEVLQNNTLPTAAYLDAVRGQLPTIVGEWSLGMAGHAVASLGNAYERDVAMRALGALQLLVMERCAGWYFWSYKLDHDLMPAWDFRACVNRGWLPSRLMPAAPPKAS